MIEMIRFGLYEAFRAGMAGKMMPKITSVLSKRIGQKLNLSPMAWDYSSPDGEFTSFYMFFGSGSALRLNFLRDKSDKIISVDYFTKPSNTPEYTIDLNGFNIIQVLDMIADVVTGDYFDYAKNEVLVASVEFDREDKLEEGRKKFSDFLDEWFLSDPDVLEEIKSGRIQIPSLYERFSKWMKDNGNVPPKFMQNFQISLKKYLDTNRIRNNIPDITVRRGRTSRADINPTEEQNFNKIVVENEHIKKFEMMEKYVEMIAQGSKFINALIVYGQAGIGKTRMVRDILARSNADYKFYSGAIRGFTALIQLLWDNRMPGKILVLDDNDAILKNQNAVNILKAALGEENRWISYVKAKPGGGGSTQEEVELADFSDEFSIDYETIPEEFEFGAKMIFLSNLNEFPEAIKSRSIAIGINMTVEQTMDLIKNSLDKVFGEFPEITMEAKQTVFDFVMEHAGGLTRIDFRKFKQALLPYLSGEAGWKDWALIQLTS